MRSRFYLLGCLVCAAALTAGGACAQQPQDQPQDPNATENNPSQPIPAIHSPLAGINGTDQDEDVTQKTIPDTRPLSGVENISLGSAPLEHSYMIPQFKIFTTADSDQLSAKGNPGWGNFTSFLGGVDLHKISGASNLTLTYLGGGTIAIGGTAGNSVVQQMGLTEALNWRRVQLTFIDQFALLPEDSFGYGGLGGGVSLPGGGSIGVQNGLTPDDSVLTTRGLRLTNTFLTQGNILLDPRSSITVAGGYSQLHYFDNDLQDFGEVIFQGGYNRQLTRKDTIAVFYRYGGYRYSGFDQSINDNSFQASYGRRVTGKLAFQISGGPDIVFLTQPLTTTSTTTPAGSSQSAQIYYSLSANLQYQMDRVGLSAMYSHGVSGGSGVLAGSLADVLSFSASRQLRRQLTGSFNVGYSHNNGLNASGTGPTTQSYGYIVSGVNLNRTMGRTMDLNVSYLAQYQTSNADFCVGPACNNNLFRQQISLGLNWHRQPLPF